MAGEAVVEGIYLEMTKLGEGVGADSRREEIRIVSHPGAAVACRWMTSGQ